MTSMSSGSPTPRVFVSLVLHLAGKEDVEPIVRSLDLELASSFERHELVLVDNRPHAMALDPASWHLRGSVVVLTLARHHDTESAMTAGLSRAIGDFVFEVDDAGATWSPGLLHRIYDTCAAGVDVVGVAAGGAGALRRMAFRLLENWSGVRTPSEQEVLRVVSRRALNAMLALPERYRHRRTLYAVTGYPSVTIVDDSSVTSPTRSAAGRQNLGKAIDLAVSTTDVGTRLGLYLALFFVLLAAGFAIYTVIAFLTLDDVEPGWTTIMLLVSLGLAGIFVVLALVSEYLTRLLTEVVQRPVYVVRGSMTSPGMGDPLPVVELPTIGATRPQQGLDED